MTERFEGHDGRECGDHDSTGRRAWCYWCTEWCYPHAPCKGCEMPALRKRCEQAERQHAEALDQIATERRSRLAAEAAARRVQALIDSYPPGSQFARSGAQALFRAALDAEQPKETP